MRRLLVLLLAGCAVEPTAVDPPHAEVPAAEVAPAPPVATPLDPVVAGRSIRLDLGPLPSRGQGWVAINDDRLGAGPCAPAGTPCLGLLRPIALAGPVTGPGTGTVTVTVPAAPVMAVQVVGWLRGAWHVGPVQRLPVDEVCDDGADDDHDGLADCEDASCVEDPACFEVACADGLDGDGDGAADCADDDCWGRGCAYVEHEVTAGQARFERHQRRVTPAGCHNSPIATSGGVLELDATGRTRRFDAAGALDSSCGWTLDGRFTTWWGSHWGQLVARSDGGCAPGIVDAGVPPLFRIDGDRVLRIDDVRTPWGMIAATAGRDWLVGTSSTGRRDVTFTRTNCYLQSSRSSHTAWTRVDGLQGVERGAAP